MEGRGSWVGGSVGILYPGHSAEDDYQLLEGFLGGRALFPVVHTTMAQDLHRLDALLDWGRAEHLAAGALALAGRKPASVVWACTSGSFAFGWDGAREQADRLAEAAGIPASSTSLAFVRAARTLGLRQVAVVATYPEDVAHLFVEFLRRGGIRVTSMHSHGIDTAAEVGTLSAQRLLQIAIDGDDTAAEAVLFPDTALHTVAQIEALERTLGKPVLTANQVSAWEGLRLAGHSTACPGLGALFAAAPPNVVGDRREEEG
jgi:maleate cis-trans isomerase